MSSEEVETLPPQQHPHAAELTSSVTEKRLSSVSVRTLNMSAKTQRITGHSDSEEGHGDDGEDDKDDKEPESDDDEFADPAETQETSPPPPLARSLTQRSQSTISSTAEARPSSEHGGSEPLDHRNSQVSITPATTVNGSVQENGQDSVDSQNKSPLSQRHISTASLDDVSLLDELPASKEPPPPVVESTPPAPATPSLVESLTNRFSRSSTGSVPTTKTVKDTPTSAPALPRKLSTPFLPSSAPPNLDKPTPPVPPPTRRSPFSWLRSKDTSNSTTNSSADSQANSRRATASSVATIGSSPTPTGPAMPVNNDLLLHRMEYNREGDKEVEGMENLKENFKKLREERERGSEEVGEPPAPTKGSTPDEEDAAPTFGSPGSARSVPAKQEEEIDWDLWQAVVDDAFKVASERPSELNRAIQAGIPPTLRGTVWQSMAASKSLELEAMYREVIDLPSNATAEDARPLFGTHWLWEEPTPQSSPELRGTSPRPDSRAAMSGSDKQWGKTVGQLEKIIKRDLGDRTSFSKYKVDQKALLNVCKAYALFDPAVSYTQGMAFIATVLLLNVRAGTLMSEEEAFCVFVKLMNKYRLRSMFQEKMKGLELRLYQYDRILEDHEPRLAIHLRRQGIESSLYAAQWFLTLFTYKFPLQLVLRVFDLLLSEGLEAPILKFGIILMRKNADTLLGMEFDHLGPYLKERLFDVYIDNTPSLSSVLEAGFFGNGGEKEVYRANDLVCDACTIEIKQETLDRYEKEWEEVERTKRETDAELENLRRTNGNLSIKVKRLEEQNEELNMEYVRIASSEVGLKVENDRFADENEALRTKVDNLRDMVDKQPQEVEDRLRAEMDALMQKNLEVHRSNQALEEQMADMERDLVSTKMQLATVNEEYDLMKNRWNDLKKAIGD